MGPVAAGGLQPKAGGAHRAGLALGPPHKARARGARRSESALESLFDPTDPTGLVGVQQCHAPEPPDRIQLGAVAAAAGIAAAARARRGVQLRPLAPPAACLPLLAW